MASKRKAKKKKSKKASPVKAASKRKARAKAKPEGSLVNFKVSPSELSKIRSNAVKYAKGNVSWWLRYASTAFKPKAALA